VPEKTGVQAIDIGGFDQEKTARGHDILYLLENPDGSLDMLDQVEHQDEMEFYFRSESLNWTFEISVAFFMGQLLGFPVDVHHLGEGNPVIDVPYKVQHPAGSSPDIQNFDIPRGDAGQDFFEQRFIQRLFNLVDGRKFSSREGIIITRINLGMLFEWYWVNKEAAAIDTFEILEYFRCGEIFQVGGSRPGFAFLRAAKGAWVGDWDGGSQSFPQNLKSSKKVNK
jgi:hypothetical protein